MAKQKFKFKFLDDGGNEQGFFSKKGSLDDDTLILGDLNLPIDLVLRAMRRFNRLILEVLHEGGTGVVALAITSGPADAIAKRLNKESSRRWAERKEKSLKEKGLPFSSDPCPACEATVDVTGHRPSPQIHCGFCDTIATLDEESPKGEASLGICDECGYYASPQPFTVFYFYFLLVVYGFRTRKAYMCHSCMRGEAWKMVFGNFLFIIGLPSALYQLFRAYFGGSVGAPAFAGLDAANALAKKRLAADAARKYDEIAERLGAAAGVHYNKGFAYLQAQQFEPATDAFEACLDDCSNYRPAAMALAGCYEKLGREGELAKLMEEWGADDDDDAPEPGAEPGA